MITEPLFIFTLFITGFVIGTLLIKNIPFWLIVTTSIFIGSLNWVINRLLVMLVLGKADFIVSTAILSFECVVSLYLLIRNKGYKLIKKEQTILFFSYLLLFLISEWMYTQFNLTNVSVDSIIYIKMGEILNSSGLTNLHWSSPASIGFFISLIQGSAVNLGIDYLHTFQPVLTTSFILFIFAATNFYFSNKINRFAANLTTISLLVLLFSSKMMQMQFSYIHTNLTSAIYLFLSLFGFYCYFKEDRKKEWMILGILFLAGFSLLRVENILVSIIFIFLMIKYLNLTYRERLIYLVPYFTFSLFIEVVLYTIKPSLVNPMLEKSEILVLILALIVSIVFIFCSKNKYLEKYIIPNIHILLIVGYGITVAFTFATKFSLMFESLKSNILAAFVTGGWGTTWIVVIPLFFFLINKTRDNFSSMLKYDIPLYYLTILSIVYFRVPYHERWSDSANRMSTQILFVCVFFILIVIVELFQKPTENKLSVDSNSKIGQY